MAEALQLARLAREGLHDAHAGDVLLGVRGQLRDPLLDLLHGRACAAPVALGDDHHERHGRHRDQAEAGVDDDHRDAREHEREDRLQDEHEPVAEEEAHRLQVDGRARHQLSRLLAVEEAQLQALEVAVEQVAQVEFDRERDPPGDHPAHVRERPAREHRADDHEREHQQRVAVVRALGELVVFGVCAAFLDRFDGEAREVGHQHRHHHREAREQPGGGQPPLVGAQKS